MAAKKENKWLVIVSGRSGAGKSVVLDHLEDLGFYCVDNLPSELIGSLLEQTVHSGHTIYNRVAIAVDARNFSETNEYLTELLSAGVKGKGMRTDVVYVDAENRALLARFKETRRLHPLSRQGADLLSALKRESELIDVMRRHATLYIDTTDETINGLRERISAHFTQPKMDLVLSFCSFGFKHSPPEGVDMVFDVRCLPNPYWDEKLRALSGKDKKVIDFLDASNETHKLFNDVSAFLKKWLPKYYSANRYYLTIGIGCTGGRHRSVYFCQRLYKLFKPEYPGAHVVHRDLT